MGDFWIPCDYPFSSLSESNDIQVLTGFVYVISLSLPFFTLLVTCVDPLQLLLHADDCHPKHTHSIRHWCFIGAPLPVLKDHRHYQSNLNIQLDTPLSKSMGQVFAHSALFCKHHRYRRK